MAYISPSQYLAALRSGNLPRQTIVGSPSSALNAAGNFIQRQGADKTSDWRTRRAEGQSRREQLPAYNLPGPLPMQQDQSTIAGISDIIGQLGDARGKYGPQPVGTPMDEDLSRLGQRPQTPMGQALVAGLSPGAETTQMGSALHEGLQGSMEPGTGPQYDPPSGGLHGFLTDPANAAALSNFGAVTSHVGSQPGASWMDAVSQGLGAAGTTLQGVRQAEAETAATRAEKDQQEMNRRQYIETMLDKAGVDDTESRQRYINLGLGDDNGFNLAVEELQELAGETAAVEGQTASIQSMLGMLNITGENANRYLTMPYETAQELLSQMITEQAKPITDRGPGSSEIANEIYLEGLLVDAQNLPDGPEKEAAMARYNAFKARIDPAPSYYTGRSAWLQDELARVSDPGWTPGDEYNQSQLNLLALHEGMPQGYGGQVPTQMETETDSDFGQKARDWVSSGRALFNAEMANLTNIYSNLQESDWMSGPLIGGAVLSERWGPLITPKGVDLLDGVREIVFKSLRETLGPQFTEAEGNRLVAASYNPYLQEEINMKRIARMQQRMQATADFNESLVQHLDDNRSFVGMQNPYSMTSFMEGNLAGHNEGTVAMAHEFIEPEDYQNLSNKEMRTAIEQDVNSLTRNEARLLLIDVSDTGGREAEELRSQLATRIKS